MQVSGSENMILPGIRGAGMTEPGQLRVSVDRRPASVFISSWAESRGVSTLLRLV